MNIAIDIGMVSAAGGVFLPTKLSGLLLWCRADSGYSGTWTDRSGQGNDLNQGSGTFEAAGFNGSPSIVLNSGSSNYLGRTGGTLMTHIAGSDKPYSIFAAAQWTSLAGTTLFFNSAHSSVATRRDDVYQAAGVSNHLRVDDASTSATSVLGHTFDLNRHRYGVVFSGTTRELYVDNVGKGSVAANVGTVTLDLFTFGAARLASAPTNFANIRVAELIILDHAASTAELAQIDSYLLRYG